MFGKGGAVVQIVNGIVIGQMRDALSMPPAARSRLR